LWTVIDTKQHVVADSTGGWYKGGKKGESVCGVERSDAATIPYTNQSAILLYLTLDRRK